MKENKFKIVLALICLIYLAASISSAYTLLPNVDEAWFTIPGYNLAEHGFFGTSTLEETASFRQVKLTGINHYTYWIMPLFPLIQAIWGKIFSFGLIQTRFVSITFGFIALLSWTFLIIKLSGNRRLALIAVGILAIDYHFIYAASLGRMDMMTASLSVSGFAIFAWLREKHLSRAILAAYTLAALAFFSHPLGLLGVISLTIFVILLDFRKIRLKHFAFSAAPFLVLGFFWSIYIMQRPDLFLLQFGGNASDRWGFFRAPFGELWREIQIRYLVNFGIGENLNRAGQVKIFLLVGYLAAIASILAIKPLRARMLSRFLLLVVLQQFFMLLLLDGMKQHYYMIHITPTLTVILAVFIDWLMSQKRPLKLLSFGVFLTIVAIYSGTHLLRVKRNEYHNNYLAVGSILNQNSRSEDLIMASSEFWFVLSKKENLLDDYRLGYLTGKRANFIVIDKPRYKNWFDNLAEKEPSTFGYMENLLQNYYQVIYEDTIYQVYKHR
jgi:4-amino-4-deoxy-L-arabinose transferase-like glycosyltransferase